jgi:WD40 repeat protein
MFTNQRTDLTLGSPCRCVASLFASSSSSSFGNRGGNGSAKVIAADDSDDNDDYGDGAADAEWMVGAKDALYHIEYHASVNELAVVARHDSLDNVRCCVAVCNSSNSSSCSILTAPEQGPSASLWRYKGNCDRENSSSSNIGRRSSGSRYDPDGQQDDAENALELVATLLPEEGFGANLVDLEWRRSANDAPYGGDSDSNSSAAPSGNDVLTLDSNGHLTRWDMEAVRSVRSVDTASSSSLLSSATRSSTGRATSTSTSTMHYPAKVVWDPHSTSGDAVAVSVGRSISILDWRVPHGTATATDAAAPAMSSSGTVGALRNCHRGAVTDLDYNPNKPHVLATAGQDGLIRFWDLRRTSALSGPSSSMASASSPILTARGGHSHWITALQYNPCHDQLLVSTGTDRTTNLWRIGSVSSAPWQDQGGGGGRNPDDDDGDDGPADPRANHHKHLSRDDDDGAMDSAPNARVDRYDQHGDSCYAVAWARNDPWMYLTACYDGKVVLSHVPSKEKYKILL